MSAIWGIWHRNRRPRAAADLDRMGERLRVYGRDMVSTWSAGEIGFGSALTMTLPEDSPDDQPCHLPSGATMVADVRLDNRRDLANLLGLALREVAQLSDTAILAAAWERWQQECLRWLVGEFAFAVWNPHTRCLFCARDHFGRRSLHYFIDGAMFAFATIPRGLHALPEARRAVDETMIATRLALLPENHRRSFFDRVDKLPPAHSLTVTADGETLTRYWQLDLHRRIEFSNDGDYCDAFREVLDEAIRCRLRSRGPVGSMLSGGFDSTTVTARAASLLADQGQRLVAFTGVPAAGFTQPSTSERFGDETHHAAAVAALYPNIRHILVRPIPTCPLDLLARPRFWSDTPGNHPCMTPYAVAMAQAQQDSGLAVVLTGVAGNMTISYHGLPLLTRLARQGRWWEWYREAQGLRAQAHFRWPGIMALSVGPFIPPGLWRAIQSRRGIDLAKVKDYSLLHPRYFDSGVIGALAAELGWDLTYRPRADGRAARAADLMRLDAGPLAAGGVATNGVDYRDPTIDKRLVEFCLAIPEEQYLRQGRTKFLLRRAMAARLPPEILNEWRKGLAGADWHLRVAPFRERFAASVEEIARSALAVQCLDIPRMRQMVERWPTDWTAPGVQQHYRLGFCRAIQAGEFIRWVEEGN